MILATDRPAVREARTPARGSVTPVWVSLERRAERPSALSSLEAWRPVPELPDLPPKAGPGPVALRCADCRRVAWREADRRWYRRQRVVAVIAV